MRRIILCLLLVAAGCAWSDDQWAEFFDGTAEGIREADHNLREQQHQWDHERLEREVRRADSDRKAAQFRTRLGL